MSSVSVDTGKNLVIVIYDNSRTDIEQMKTALSDSEYPVKDAIFHKDVTPQEAKERMAADKNLLILDVREPDEFQSGHISGAVNYPWDSGVLRQEYGKLSADNSVLLVCKTGTRSSLAANFLISAGFTKVYDMIGGMDNMNIPVNYLDIGNIGHDLKFDISCVQYHGTQYRFAMNYSPSSSDSMIWRMDNSSFEQITVPGDCLSVGDDLRLNLNAEYNSVEYSFTMNYMINSNDPLAWKMDASTLVHFP